MPAAILFLSLFAAASSAPAKLRAPALQRLRVGATRPLGWLRRELLLQARGMTSQLPNFWHYLNVTKWMGPHGTEPEQFLQHRMDMEKI